MKTLKNVDLQVTGKIRMMPDGNFRFTNSPPDFSEAKRGIELVKKAVRNPKNDLVICDEVMSCILTKLVSEEDVLGIISEFEIAGRSCELVLTGRSLPESIKSKSDLVTEMKMLKHYYNKGLPARKGIEF